jgi:hypothetical protein
MGEEELGNLKYVEVLHNIDPDGCEISVHELASLLALRTLNIV